MRAARRVGIAALSAAWVAFALVAWTACAPAQAQVINAGAISGPSTTVASTDLAGGDGCPPPGGVILPPIGLLPLVTITSPTGTYTTPVGSTVNFTITVTSPNPITAVQLYDGPVLPMMAPLDGTSTNVDASIQVSCPTILLGTAGSAGGGTYTFVWNTTGVRAGLHRVVAAATDRLGRCGVSAPVVVNLTPVPPPVPPVVTITSPTSTYATPVGSTVNFTITATSSSAIASVKLFDGPVPPMMVPLGASTSMDASVQFACPTILLGSAGFAADGTYTFAWDTTGVRPGLHRIVAVATDSAGASGASAPVVVNLTPVPPPPPPVVTITSPTGTYTTPVGSTVNFTITATSSNKIASVQVYDGQVFFPLPSPMDVDATISGTVGISCGIRLLGTASLAGDGTYTFAWDTTGQRAGRNCVFAIATDSMGSCGLSAPVVVILTPVPPPAPSPMVTITSPTSMYTTPVGSVVNFTITATSSNPITSVQLYDGPVFPIMEPLDAAATSTDASIQVICPTILLGSADLAADGTYTFAWDTTGVRPGLHRIVASATDSTGASGSSAPVLVNLTLVLPPVVTITSPTRTVIIGCGHTVPFNVTATTTNLGGWISQVELYDGAVKAGNCVTGDGAYAWTWSTASCGLHSFQAKATDDGARTAVSPEVVVQVCVPGDANGDGVVDGADFAVWGAGYHKAGASFATGDFNGDGVVDGLDFAVWGANYNHKATYASDPPVASAAQGAAGLAASQATAASAGPAPKLVAASLGAGTLVLTFDSDVTVGAGAVEVYGAVSGAQAYSAAYADGKLTLTLRAPLAADTYTVRVISDFVVGAGGPLDGEVADPADMASLPSGDGESGGDALLEFQIR